MKLSLSRVSIFAFALGFAVLAQAKDHDRRGCDNRSLRGDFAFTAEGTTLAALALPAALTGAFSSGGFTHFDGAGHFTLIATTSFNGAVQGPATVAGTYSVNEDCSYTSKASNGVTFRAAIVDDGHEILILQTTPGTVIAGVAKKRGSDEGSDSGQDREGRHGTCSAETFSGNYGFLAKGFAGPPTLPTAQIAPLAGVGIIHVDFNGTFTMSAQRSAGGAIDPDPLTLTGSYTLSPDCTAQLTFDVGFHFTATIVSGDEAFFIETDPGTAVSVIAKRL
ncbi:MAG: hypothetical protein ACJ74Y_15240 [Bryobacteraceae bacterium]